MWTAIFEEESLVNQTKDSPTTTLTDRLNVHAFEYKVTGTGSVSIEIFTSISGEVWISNGIKVQDGDSSSGPGQNGSDIIPLRIKPGDLIKFRTIVAGSIVLSLWFTQK